MADASLDDFFAKKDKSKKKAKKQVVDIDSLAHGDEPKKAKKKKKKDKENNETEEKAPVENKKAPAEENEWVDFEEEKEADYTGLRIGTLQINKEAKEDEEQNGEEEEGEEGEGGEPREPKEKKQEGPWMTDPDYMPPPPPPAPVEKKPEPPKPVVTGGKYVPPSLRAGGAASMDAPVSRPRRKKEAPNIKSEDDFPTLGIAPDASGAGRFEEVRGSGGGNRPSDDPSKRIQQLELGNKFGALSDNYN